MTKILHLACLYMMPVDTHAVVHHLNGHFPGEISQLHPFFFLNLFQKRMLRQIGAGLFTGYMPFL